MKGEESMLRKKGSFLAFIACVFTVIGMCFGTVIVEAKSKCKLYVDINFNENLMFSRYNVDLEVDGELIDTLEHGKYYTKLIEVDAGKHKISFYKSDDSDINVSETIEISKDSTFQCEMSTTSEAIVLDNIEVIDNIKGSTLKMKDCTFMVLQDAYDSLEKTGFVNIVDKTVSDETVYDRENWIVVEQNVEAGSKIDKNESIVLTCQRFEEYLDQVIKGSTYKDAKEKLEKGTIECDYFHTIDSKRMGTRVDKISEKEAVDWQVTDVERKEGKKIKISLMYVGEVEMPNVIGEEVSAASSLLLKKELADISFVDRNGAEVAADSSDYVVIEQSEEEGSTIMATDSVQLTCQTKEAFVDDQFKDLSIKDIDSKAKELGYSVSYIHKIDNAKMDDKVSDLNDKDKELWQAEVVEPGKESKSIKAYLAYTGEVEMPEVVGKASNEAFTALYKEELSNVTCLYNGQQIDPKDEGYIIITQSVEKDTEIKGTDPIELTCETKDEYVKHQFVGMEIQKVDEKAKDLGYTVEFKHYGDQEDMNDKVKDMSESDLALWQIKDGKAGDDKTAILYLCYTGESEMPNLAEMQVDRAVKELYGKDFSNIKCISAGQAVNLDDGAYIVVSQSVAAGTKVRASDPVELGCEKKVDYINKHFANLTLPELTKKAEEMKYSVTYRYYLGDKDMTDDISKMTDEEKNLWKAKVITPLSEDRSVEAKMVYTGSAEVTDEAGKNVKAAVNDLESKAFSNISCVDLDGAPVSNTDTNYKVYKMSVQPGQKVNASDPIVLTCYSEEEQKEKNLVVYKKKGFDYDIYYIFNKSDSTYVYYTTDGKPQVNRYEGNPESEVTLYIDDGTGNEGVWHLKRDGDKVKLIDQHGSVDDYKISSYSEVEKAISDKGYWACTPDCKFIEKED